MSTVKTDNVVGSFTPLPVIASANAVETYLASVGQTVFTTAKFDQSNAIKVFAKVGDTFVEVTAKWTGSNTVTISGITLTASQKVYIYSVGDASLRSDLGESTAVTVWSFRNFVTTKVNPSDWKTWDWRPAIQAAIDYCAATGRGELYFDRLYPVSLDPAAPAVTNAYSSGAVAICLKAAIRLFGPGGVILIAGQGKSDGAIIGNPYTTAITGRVVIDIEIDGNSANTIGTVSGVLLVGTKNPVFTLNCHSHNVTRHGIMCRPNAAQAGMTDTVMEVHGARVHDCGGIGIQGTRVKDFIHTGSQVSNTVDNLIDVYGNDAAGGASAGFVGKALISGPILNGGPTGIFIESFSDWQITDFDIRNCNGIKLNRINSGALDGNIKRGKIKGKDDLTSTYGVSINNSSGYCFIDDVHFDQMNDSVVNGSGTDRLLMGTGNTHRRIGRYIISHSKSANQLVKSTIRDQYIYEEALSVTGFPQLTPPLSHPLFATAQYLVSRGTLRSIANNKDLGVDFEVSTAVLTSPGAWGGAFSLFNVGSDGETRINTNPDVAGLPKYVTISGVAYYLVASGTSGEYYARLWNGTTAVAGNYTASLNSALTVSVKYDAFATA